jgi:methylated-DNA-[protein]-cysteine S-methyltransferase
MAGKKLPEIHCSNLKIDRLTVHLASTRKGAIRAGLDLNGSGDSALFFKKLFPNANLIKDDRLNRPLGEAIEAALLNNPEKNPLPLDFSCTPFQWSVLKAIATIPFGETRTYGEVASMVGKPGGARAVGQVMGKNPLPLIFP